MRRCSVIESKQRIWHAERREHDVQSGNTSGEPVEQGQVTRRQALAERRSRPGIGSGHAGAAGERGGHAHARPRRAPSRPPSRPQPSVPTTRAGCRTASARASSTTSTASRCTCSRPASRPRGRPALLLLHGFPELAYSWRHVMAPLADAGYHVIAPRPARLRAHHGLERRLRRQPAAVQPDERGARRPRTRLGVRVPHGGRGDRP